VDSVVQDLDDKVQALQNMKNSPDINQKLKQDCLHLGAKIDKFSKVLNLWVRVQSLWIYLEPIFGNEDIKEQLRSEATKFEQYNKQWIERMRESNADKKVSTHIEAENLHDIFIAGNTTLDEISKGMNIYLNKKRFHFARFFFLLDNTLIEVIALTKTPEMIQD
jgi:dynein heavy chain